METLDEPIMGSEKEQHGYKDHTSVSENKTEETTETNTNLGQYFNFQKKLRKELGTLYTSFSCIIHGFIYGTTRNHNLLFLKICFLCLFMPINYKHMFNLTFVNTDI